METTKQISKEKALSIYLKENGNIKGPDYKHYKRILKKYNKAYLVELNIKELENITMSNHFLCNCKNFFNIKGIIWENFGGLKLKDLVSKILSNKQYPKKYPICWNKIEIQKKLLLKNTKNTISLVQGKPSSFNLSYIGLKNIKENLYLIDGFHRLIALVITQKIPNNLRFILVK